ncbi:hypothetical protein [Actinoplanes sp. NPDC051859]|uniref:hypothetical protein n=1 Tax=Actinoplanes sp. NPDC051859 TaxID=3363909 RepID=UPI0037928FA4
MRRDYPEAASFARAHYRALQPRGAELAQAAGAEVEPDLAAALAGLGVYTAGLAPGTELSRLAVQRHPVLRRNPFVRGLVSETDPDPMIRRWDRDMIQRWDDGPAGPTLTT